MCCSSSGEAEPHRRPTSRFSFGEAAKQAAIRAGLPVVSQLSHHRTKTNLLDNLIQEVASPRSYTLLKEYNKQSKADPAVPLDSLSQLPAFWCLELEALVSECR